ncbi:MAG: 4Fe-4S dicluster domain-containing protein [Promethearchaeota archaeon]
MIKVVDYYTISVKDFVDFLKSLLENKIVDKVISGIEKKNRYTISPKIISSSAELDNFPLSQLFVFNFSRIDSASKFLHKQGGAKNEKIAMIGHPCDGRAIIELSKRLQVNYDNVFKIIMEDFGVITNNDFRKFLKGEGIDESSLAGEFLTEDSLVLKLNDGTIKEYKLGEKINITANCTRCFRKKLDDNFDIAISFIGLEPFSDNLILKVGSDNGKNALSKSRINMKPVDSNILGKFNEIQSRIIDEAKNKREKELKEWLNKPNRIQEIAKCTMCGMCINSCPVCFCKSCILQKQRKEKTIDKLTYQLTRIAHVGDACVGCGKCDQNCPPKLPLSLYFQSLNDYIKEKFGYVAGLDKNAPMIRSKQSVENIE